jgi:hypothetical protein
MALATLLTKRQVSLSMFIPRRPQLAGWLAGAANACPTWHGPTCQISNGFSCLRPSSTASKGSYCLGPSSQVYRGPSVLGHRAKYPRGPRALGHRNESPRGTRVLGHRAESTRGPRVLGQRATSKRAPFGFCVYKCTCNQAVRFPMLFRIYAAINATVCTLYFSDLRICSSRQIYSTDILQFRIAQMQQSLKRRTFNHVLCLPIVLRIYAVV